MSLWDQFVRALMSRCERPTVASPIYIVFIIILIGACLAVIFLNKKISPKIYKIIILITWIVFVIFETLKQITMSGSIDAEGKMHYAYDWYYFPFQFCSCPLYILPFIIFLKEGPVKKRVELFTATFMIIGGLINVVIPQFCETIFINYQTIIHHGSMVFIGILVAIKNKDQFVFRNFLECSIVFLILVAIALSLNAIVPACIPGASSDFNMFFISWHNCPGVEIFAKVWKAVPYPVFLMLYIIGFNVSAFIIYSIYSLIFHHKISIKLKDKYIKEVSTAN